MINYYPGKTCTTNSFMLFQVGSMCQVVYGTITLKDFVLTRLPMLYVMTSLSINTAIPTRPCQYPPFIPSLISMMSPLSFSDFFHINLRLNHPFLMHAHEASPWTLNYEVGSVYYMEHAFHGWILLMWQRFFHDPFNAPWGEFGKHSVFSLERCYSALNVGWYSIEWWGR